jgi:hypothetical protein
VSFIGDVQNHVGGPVSRTPVKQVPLLLLAWPIGRFTVARRTGFINVVLPLVVISGFRARARRLYGVDGKRSAAAGTRCL